MSSQQHTAPEKTGEPSSKRAKIAPLKVTTITSTKPMSFYAASSYAPAAAASSSSSAISNAPVVIVIKRDIELLQEQLLVKFPVSFSSEYNMSKISQLVVPYVELKHHKDIINNGDREIKILVDEVAAAHKVFTIEYTAASQAASNLVSRCKTQKDIDYITAFGINITKYNAVNITGFNTVTTFTESICTDYDILHKVRADDFKFFSDYAGIARSFSLLFANLIGISGKTIKKHNLVTYKSLLVMEPDTNIPAAMAIGTLAGIMDIHRLAACNAFTMLNASIIKLLNKAISLQVSYRYIMATAMIAGTPLSS